MFYKLNLEHLETCPDLDINDPPELFLVVGTRLAAPGARDYAKHMIQQVHQRQGIAVFVSIEVPPSNIAKYFDIILIMDCQIIAVDYLEAMVTEWPTDDHSSTTVTSRQQYFAKQAQEDEISSTF